MKVPLATVALIALTTVQGFPQRASGSSAATASAELIKGELNPAKSKPGDEVRLRLKEDVKSNGDVVLQKGTVITGIVRQVNRVDQKGESPVQTQSLIDIEWVAPASQYGESRQLMVAVQSVNQFRGAPRQDSSDDWDMVAPANRSTAGKGQLGRTTGLAANVAPESNVALLSMPSIVAADVGTAAEVHTGLGMSGSQQLFQTGHGQIVTLGGFKDSIEIFSHLNNDTVLASHSRSFEISSGAQMKLLVGIRKK